MQLNFVYDSSVQNAPAGFKQGLAIAAGIIDAIILNPISVTIAIGYGEDNGSPLASTTLGEAQPAFGVLLSYGELVANLNKAATSADDATFLNHLPAADPSSGGGFFVSATQAIAWGVISGSANGIEGYAGFSSTLPFTYTPTNGIAPGTYDFVGVALHELTHALGRTVTPSWLTPLNLLGYGSNGLIGTRNSDPRYVSIDGGKTSLANFDTKSDQADFTSISVLDPFAASIAGGSLISWTSLDTRTMDLLGYRTTSAGPAPPPQTAPGAPTPLRTVTLHGSHDQYVVADASGSLYLQDTVDGRDGTRILPAVRQMFFTDGIGIFDPTGTAETVAPIYQAAFHRAPDAGGLEAWTTAIDTSHVPLSAVANSFAKSPEFIRTYGSVSDAGFINLLYQNTLGRPADAAGAQHWEGLLASGTSRGELMLAVAESPERKASSLTTTGDTSNAEVYRLYQTALGRPADLAGENYWASTLASGVTPSQVAQNFINSAEFQQKYGALGISDFVSTLYFNALHRSADPAGLQAWTGALQHGASKASLIAGFSDSLENRVQTAGATHANWVFIPA